MPSSRKWPRESLLASIDCLSGSQPETATCRSGEALTRTRGNGWPLASRMNPSMVPPRSSTTASGDPGWTFSKVRPAKPGAVTRT